VFWIGAFAVAELMLVQASVAGALAGLCILGALFAIQWWQPLLLALALLVAAPFAAALGAGSSLDSYAVVALALFGSAVVLAGFDTRRRA
jgi:hypothetical protein